MKNIYILPTDQPSRLHHYMFGCWSLSKEPLNWRTASHIYITSDEEISTDDYYICLINNDFYKADHEDLLDKDRKHWKKIVLTTDPTLIEKGIQKIPNKFLEWFIENPTCEYVEVINDGPGFPADIYWINYLQIELDFSEVTQDKQTLLTAYNTAGLSYSSILGNVTSGIEPIRSNEHLTKTESLEEAAKNYGRQNASGYFVEQKSIAFTDGANWQAKQMYSKKDSDHLEFIYNRLIEIHKENPNTDYMLKFKEIINK